MELEVGFITLLFATYLIWFLLICFLKFQKSIYFFSYFILTGILFLGPIVYFQLGFIGYKSAISDSSTEEFMIFGILTNLVNILNLIIVKLFHRSKAKTLNLNIEQNDRIYKSIFRASTLGFIVFFLAYFKKIPITNLILEGEIGERLDGSGEIPFFITLSSFFMIYLPSSYLYFKSKNIKSSVKYFLLVLSILALVFGGNKGLVSFFLLFLFFFSRKKSIIRGLTLIILILFTYAVFKGKTQLNDETISYLVESPVRRLLAAQGVGFITRIEMSNKRLLVQNQEIKKQVNSYIYNTPYGTGSSPTNFAGTIYVRKGAFIALTLYSFISLIITYFLIRIDTLGIKFSIGLLSI